MCEFLTEHWDWAILSVAVALFIWYWNGFRPRVYTYISAARDRIKVTIKNYGRQSGTVQSISFRANKPSADGTSIIWYVQEYIWLKVGEIPATEVNGMGTVQFVVEADPAHQSAFAEGTMVRVNTTVKQIDDYPIHLKRQGISMEDQIPTPTPAEINTYILRNKNRETSQASEVD